MKQQERIVYTLIHMLGLGRHIPTRDRGYRNHFCATIGSPDYSTMLDMRDLGLVVEGRIINNGTSQYFHATKHGMKVVGMTDAEIERCVKE